MKNDKELKVGMHCYQLKLPHVYIGTYLSNRSWDNAEVVDVYFDKRFVKINAKLSNGGYHTDWYTVDDIFKVNDGKNPF